jgi:hypothetical protein
MLPRHPVKGFYKEFTLRERRIYSPIGRSPGEIAVMKVSSLFLGISWSILNTWGSQMKRNGQEKTSRNLKLPIISDRARIKAEGKFLHGTRGKSTRGARGNKKY